MSLEGNLATLDLADLLQNLEQNRRTGTLTLETADRGTPFGGAAAQAHGHAERLVYFDKGRIVQFGYAGRADLGDVLADAGRIAPEALAKARKGRRPKSLVERLAKHSGVGRDELQSMARARLTDELCELVNTQTGAFRFEQGAALSAVLDPDERLLELDLAVEPLLLEAARRSDHWALIRQQIPSDSAHYVLARQPDPNTCNDPELASALAERLDGTRCVRAALRSFPHRRFEAYLQLSEWVERQQAYLAQPTDLLALAQSAASRDPERAQEILGHALEIHPQHAGLLTEAAGLAEDLGAVDDAVDALKMLAHLAAESGDGDAARAKLERALGLKPVDTTLWERAFGLDLSAGDLAQARETGQSLSALYRAPGLHRKVLSVWERLVAADPDDPQLRIEWARALSESGDKTGAVDGLAEAARKRIRAGDEACAQQLYTVVVELDPENAGAQGMLRNLENQLYSKRRQARKRFVRRSVVAVAFVLVSTFGWYEGRARVAYWDVQQRMSAGYWIEDGRYGEAITALEELRDAHPLALSSVLDMNRRIADLRERQAEYEAREQGRASRPVGAADSRRAAAQTRGDQLPLSSEATFVPAPADAAQLLGDV